VGIAAKNMPTRKVIWRSRITLSYHIAIHNT
jgi:hypothetical protein